MNNLLTVFKFYSNHIEKIEWILRNYSNSLKRRNTSSKLDLPLISRHHAVSFFRKRAQYINGPLVNRLDLLLFSVFVFLGWFFAVGCDVRGWLEQQCEFNCKSVRLRQWKVEDRGWSRRGGRFRFRWIGFEGAPKLDSWTRGTNFP